MKKRTGITMAVAVAVGMVGFGAAPAFAVDCASGNMCSWTGTSKSGSITYGGGGDFVEVADDTTDSAENLTSKNYNAKNNTAFGQEQTIAYISAGTYISTFGANNNTIDHYRKA